MTSTAGILSSHWLQFLIGPAAASTTKKLYAEDDEDRIVDSSNTAWLWAAMVGMLVTGQCIGGWGAVFAELETLVVPIYTTLVLIYLTILIVAGPLVSLYGWLLPKNKKEISEKPSTPVVADVIVDEAVIHAEQPFDLSGAYKLVRNDNFEGFLAVQGVPWALRRAANQARPVHRITHLGNQLTIKIEGIIESQTTYIIGGAPVETNVRGRIFEDVVRYLEDNVTGIRVSKTALTEDYDVTVQRVLSTDLQEITASSRAVFRDGRDPVECVQKFQRIE
jgi:hypothetical protein